MLMDDDQVLIKKILDGRKSSFEELMRRYNRKIYNFVFRMVRNDEVASELTQDFFIKIFTVLHKYNFEYKFSTWAYRICYNLVIDYIRKNQAFVDSLSDNQVSQKKLLESRNYICEDGFNNLEKDEIKQYLWDRVGLMPGKYKELILLRYLQELKYDEIAEITDLPVGTVKNRIFKAKELLRREIEKDGMFK